MTCQRCNRPPMKRTVSEHPGITISNPPWPLSDEDMSRFEIRLRRRLEEVYLDAQLDMTLYIERADERGRISREALYITPVPIIINRGQLLLSPGAPTGTSLSVALPSMSRLDRLIIGIRPGPGYPGGVP